LRLRVKAKAYWLKTAAFEASRAGLRFIHFGGVPDERD
jgi:hypothetical protein